MQRKSLFASSLLVVLALSLVLFAQEKEKESSTIMGTLVDVTCFAKMGVTTNDHGEMKGCGTMCAKGGLPVAIVDSDKKVHLLAVPAPAYADYVGLELRLTGMANSEAGVFIPEKMAVKEDGKWVDKMLPKTEM